MFAAKTESKLCILTLMYKLFKWCINFEISSFTFHVSLISACWIQQYYSPAIAGQEVITMCSSLLVTSDDLEFYDLFHLFLEIFHHVPPLTHIESPAPHRHIFTGVMVTFFLFSSLFWSLKHFYATVTFTHSHKHSNSAFSTHLSAFHKHRHDTHDNKQFGVWYLA